MGFVNNIDSWAEKCVNDPEWMADCLYRLYRFGGQHPESTVLRHSVEVWHMARKLPADQQLWALLHDAHEILTGEITRIVKSETTKSYQCLADFVLKSMIGIPGVVITSVEQIDTEHGNRELATLDLFLAGKITREQLGVNDYHHNWFDAKWDFLSQLETLKAQI